MKNDDTGQRHYLAWGVVVICLAGLVFMRLGRSTDAAKFPERHVAEPALTGQHQPLGREMGQGRLHAAPFLPGRSPRLLLDLNAEALARAKQELGPRTLALRVDVTDPAAVRKTIDQAAEEAS